jgi:hypothetical protein
MTRKPARAPTKPLVCYALLSSHTKVNMWGIKGNTTPLLALTCWQ